MGLAGSFVDGLQIADRLRGIAGEAIRGINER